MVKCLEGEINKLQTVVTNQTVTLLGRVSNRFKVACRPRSNLAKDEKAISLQTATALLVCGGTASAIY